MHACVQVPLECLPATSFPISLTEGVPAIGSSSSTVLVCTHRAEHRLWVRGGREGGREGEREGERGDEGRE